MFDLVQRTSPFVSIIKQIEVLGFHRITPNEIRLGNKFFSAATLLPLSDAIVDKAIHLRQLRKIKLGDAIIAATALVHGLTLATHNTKDFKWIESLELIDPISDR